MGPRITACIATKDRRHLLHHAVWSLRNQSYPNWDLIIVEDGSEPWNPVIWFHDPLYSRILRQLELEGHRVRLVPGPKIGRVGAAFQAGLMASVMPYRAHSGIQQWDNPWFFRSDDDVVLEPDYLESLSQHCLADDVGGLSGLMLTPGVAPEILERGDPRYEHGKILRLSDSCNPQWYRHRNPLFEVEHLHSVQLLRRDVLLGINGFETELYESFREETQVSYRIHLEGYKLLVIPKAVGWHMKAPSGGVRANNRTAYIKDIRTFSIQRNSMKPGIHVSLGHSIGDCLMATPMLIQLRETNPKRNISVWHPRAKDVLRGFAAVDEIATEPLGAQRTARLSGSVYEWATQDRFEGHLTEAYCRMFNLPCPQSLQPILGVDEGTRASVKAKLGAIQCDTVPLVLIAPSSSALLRDFSGPSRNKDWPPENWLLLADALVDRTQCGVIQLAGPNEEHIAGLYWSGSLQEAFALISCANLVISVDTMAHHAAAALGIPTIVLWGRTQPKHYGHKRPNIIDIQGTCPGVPVRESFLLPGSRVLQPIKLIRSRPCIDDNPWSMDLRPCPIDGHPCMNSITVEQVLEAAIRLLETRTGIGVEHGLS